MVSTAASMAGTVSSAVASTAVSMAMAPSTAQTTLPVHLVGFDFLVALLLVHLCSDHLQPVCKVHRFGECQISYESKLYHHTDQPQMWLSFACWGPHSYKLAPASVDQLQSHQSTLLLPVFSYWTLHSHLLYLVWGQNGSRICFLGQRSSFSSIFKNGGADASFSLTGFGIFFLPYLKVAIMSSAFFVPM